MTNKIPAPGEFYKHFKNKYYQILAIAAHSETKEKMVVYQALYDEFGVYVRPLDMFISEVDHEKYPEVKQKFRFEQVTAKEVCEAQKRGIAGGIGVMDREAVSKTSENDNNSSGDKPESARIENRSKSVLDKVLSGERDSEEELAKKAKERAFNAIEEEQPDPTLMAFLDIDGMNEKSKFLSENKKKLNDDLINAMAASLDVTIPDGPLELRYSSLRTVLQTKAKYEVTRLRNI